MEIPTPRQLLRSLGPLPETSARTPPNFREVPPGAFPGTRLAGRLSDYRGAKTVPLVNCAFVPAKKVGSPPPLENKYELHISGHSCPARLFLPCKVTSKTHLARFLEHSRSNSQNCISQPKPRENQFSKRLLELRFRKSAMSTKFLSAILGPEMAAPILWAPGIFGFFFCWKTPMP